MFTALPVVPTPAQAQTDVPLDWSLKPSGLGRGDTFRLMFITSGTTSGASDEITFYDNHVKGAAINGHPDIREHRLLFRVLGSTDAVDARDHTNTNPAKDGRGEPIYWLGGGKIADHYADFYDGLWASREPRNELGSVHNPDLVFTGSFNSGAKHDHPLGSATPRAGDPDESSPANRRVLSKENVAQSTRLPFYGMSPVFRVQAVVPDPPGNVRAVRDSEGLVTVTWSAPYDGGAAITQYLVTVLRHRTGTGGRLGPMTFKYTVANVPLDLEVFVEAQAENRVGNSQFVEVNIPAGVVTESISGDGLTWTLAGQTEVVQGEEYTYTLARIRGDVPEQERFGFHSNTLGTDRFSDRDDPMSNCEESDYFCTYIFFSHTHDYKEATVGSINFGYSLLRAFGIPIGGSYTVSVRVADNAPVGTTINMGLIDGNTPRTPSLILTVLKRPNIPAAGRPMITGTAVVGQTLTADISAITDRDGLPGKDDFSYQWIVNDGDADSEVSGATDATYMLSGNDIGKTVKVQVSFTDDRDNQEVVTSEATDPVDGAIVSISEPEGQFEEGHSGSDNQLVFTLTRTHRTAIFTTVNVEVAWDPPGDMFFDGMSPEELTATFAAGSDKTELVVPIHGDEVWDPHTSVTASVESGYGYLPSESDNSAVKTVNDDDLPEMAVELVLSSMAVEEDIGSFTVRVVARTDRDEEPHRDLPLSLVTEAGTAESPSDYEAVDRVITLSEWFMRGQDNFYTAEFDPLQVRVTIHDDMVDERGRDEEFSLLVSHGGDVNADAVRLLNEGRYRVSILDLNEGPEITAMSSFDALENSTGVFTTLTATDGDNDPLTWSIAGGADGDAFTLTGDGRLSFTDAKNFEKPDDANKDRIYEVVVEVADGYSSTTRPITVRLKDVNEGPEITGMSSFDALENSTGVFATLTATDPEGDPLMWSITGGADRGAFTLTGDGGLSFTDAKDFEKPDDADKDRTYEVVVTVSDVDSNSAARAITVMLKDVNESPEITSASSFTVKENSIVEVLLLEATDPEGAELTWSIAGGADRDAFTLTRDDRLFLKSAKNFEIPDDADEDGIYEVVVVVVEIADDGSDAVSQTITFTLEDVNEGPEITGMSSFDALENSTGVFATLTATDPEGDPLMWSIAGGADGGAFTLTGDGRLSFTSAKDFENPDDVGSDRTYEVVVEVAAAGSDQVSQTITVRLDDVNESPEITSASSFTVKENSTAVFATLTATDPEGAELTWSIAGGADTLAFDLTEDGMLSFKSAKDFERPDDVGEDRTYELDVEVGDGTNSVPQTITVVLKDVNESPETDRVLSFDVEENSTAVFTTLTATDPEDDPLTWSIAGGEDGGAFTLTGDGRLFFTSAKDFEGPDDVGKDGTYHLTVRVSDGANSRTAAITVTLSDDMSREFSLGFSSLPFLPPGSSATVTLTLVNATSLEASEQVVVKLMFMPPDGVSAALVPAPEIPISELTFSRDVSSHDLILTVAGDAQTPVVTLRAEVPSHNLNMTIITPAELTIYLYDSIRMRIKVFLEGALN